MYFLLSKIENKNRIKFSDFQFAFMLYYVIMSPKNVTSQYGNILRAL